MRKILLSMITVSVVVLADFSRDSNGIVTDTTTNLMWQDDYSDNGGSIKKATWEEAITYCEALSLGGYDNWRLPNIKELSSIIDDTKYSPTINTSIFINTTLGNYWSSTTNAHHRGLAWVVFFRDGNLVKSHYKSSSHFIRCVRDGE